ncbi:class I SAM-dependent methyltransferase [Ornithinibacillus salinisoli]|uniref:Class I SAM-dependent methyltransferase n=1 Tax=Ornithinibacillus salinisoli TaxID=1848459 RepID=A0ABW4W0E6_9BACI
MIITTARRSQSELVSRANKLANSFDLPYIERNGFSIEALKERYKDDIVVVGKDGLIIAPIKKETNIFFHPNLAMVRAKRMLKGEVDPLIQAIKLKEGMSFLDCTLGLASDSIIASIAVGNSGLVIGIEGNLLLYLLAKDGLASFTSGNKNIDQAMRKVQVVHQDHYSFLQQAASDSVDVVYFDPMFQASIDTSSGINSIRGQALFTDISAEVISEAKRVAKKRVVLKDHWKSKRFTQHGFMQLKRKTSLFHYGTIELT